MIREKRSPEAPFTLAIHSDQDHPLVQPFISEAERRLPPAPDEADDATTPTFQPGAAASGGPVCFLVSDKFIVTLAAELALGGRS